MVFPEAQNEYICMLSGQTVNFTVFLRWSSNVHVLYLYTENNDKKMRVAVMFLFYFYLSWLHHC